MTDHEPPGEDGPIDQESPGQDEPIDREPLDEDAVEGDPPEGERADDAPVGAGSTEGSSSGRSDGGEMRSVTLRLSPPGGSHPAYRLFETESGFARERLYHINVLRDGTVVLLGQFRGDLALARRLVDSAEPILDYSISRIGEGRGLAYAHVRPPPAIKEFVELQRDHEVIFEFPIDATRDGDLRVTAIAETDDHLRAVLSAIPEALDVTVERIGAYPRDSVATVLTERQREVLSAAVDAGYYEVPREATHEELADRLDLSVGTVSEHLQKVEARVFGTLVE